MKELMSPCSFDYPKPPPEVEHRSYCGLQITHSCACGPRPEGAKEWYKRVDGEVWHLDSSEWIAYCGLSLYTDFNTTYTPPEDERCLRCIAKSGIEEL